MSQAILLADDSTTVRIMARRALTEAGYEVLTARDGVEAVELAREHRPQLAILDIIMPEMDGYAVCEEFKKMGDPWDKLPILFLTSVRSNALELLGQAFGAYLSKPVQPDLLVSMVQLQLGEPQSTC